MSETEFDSYLSLLSKFLRLRARQRAELADELRDHLDSRLEELLASGKTREQAVQVALEEFGDAALLAEDFSRLASRRTKRFVMRCTAASAAVVAAVLLVSLAVAPPGPIGPGPENLIAQGPGPAGDVAADPAAVGSIAVPAIPDKPSIEQQAVADLDRKLGKVLSEVRFVEQPLVEVLKSVADQIEADLLIDEPALTDEGITHDDAVTLELNRTAVSARTALGFILEPRGLTFVNRAGVIFVTTSAEAEELLTTKVYNVRDLLENATSHAGMMGGMGGAPGGMGGGGFFSVADAAALLAAHAAGQFGGGGGVGADGAGMESGGVGMGSGGGGMGGMGGMPSPPSGPGPDLIKTIQQTTGGPWMDSDGAGGTITLFNGLLVVRQTEQNHAELQKLLEALREAGRQSPGGSVTVPKEGSPAPAADPTTGAIGYPGTPFGAAEPPPRPATREQFHKLLGEFPLQDASRDLLLEEFRSSGGRRSLGQISLFGTIVGRSGWGSIEQNPLSDSTIAAAFQSLNVEPQIVSEEAVRSGIQGTVESPDELLKLASAEADRLGSPKINQRHLLLALLSDQYPPIRDFLAGLGLTREELRSSLSRETSAPEGANADAKAAWQLLGLKLGPLDRADALAGTRFRSGMRIIEVRSDSPAAKDGLKAGDLLVGLGSWEIAGPENLAFVLRKTQEENSQHVKAYIVREGETLFLTLPFEASASPTAP